MNSTVIQIFGGNVVKFSNSEKGEGFDKDSGKVLETIFHDSIVSIPVKSSTGCVRG